MYIVGWLCFLVWFAIVAFRAIHLHLDIVRSCPEGYTVKWWVVPWATRGHVIGMLLLAIII